MNTSFGVVRVPALLPPQVLQARYDRAAQNWEATLARFGFQKAYRSLLQRQDWSAVSGRRVDVLDLGVGTGALSVATITALHGQGRQVGRVAGVDMSATMLAKAQEAIASSGAVMDAVQGDVEALPFADASFDVVLAAHVIEHLGRPLRAMAEIDRVLRPGGRVVFMLTRCGPITLRIQKHWSVQCARSRKLEAVLRDFGMDAVRCVSYPRSLICNLMSFCCIAEKPSEAVHG